ncbi:hypothetical protein VSDG_05261 [Cytospora chrysosperma]|uniref:Transcription factor domain-containing protein n=1 Tax=Cytospora chrysosperma TaxID=252740 RepID=A0A423VWW3_CYTCH|nr:hypothetical protein VSDG_05261 [Valsa sordida]
MAAASKSTQTKIALNQRIKQTLTQRMFLDQNPGAVNIDLLLGLLTFLAWGHDHLLQGTPATLSRFTQLAMTVAFDLRLNKPLGEDSNMLPVGSLNGATCTAPADSARSLEARRAVLGCFVMSSIVSSYFAQIDPMQWTPYMEECLELVSQNRECPYDEIFAHQVRLQRVAQEVEIARGTTIVSAAFYSSALRRRVGDIKAQISPHLQQDTVLLASIYYTELSIFGLLLSKQDHTPTFQRLECFHACLGTVKSALDCILKLPIVDYRGSSFPFFTQVARYMIVLYKLTTLSDPAWDTGLVRSTIDVVQVMDQLIANMQQARVADGEQAAEGFLDRSARIFMSFRQWCAGKIDEGTAGAAGQASTHGVLTGGDNGFLLDPPGFSDIWLQENFSYGVENFNYGVLEGNDFF